MIKKLIFTVFSLLVFASYGQILKPFEWETEVVKLSDSDFELIARAKIDEGWHLYAMVPPSQPYQAVALTDAFGADLAARAEWRAPVATPYAGARGVLVWEGRCEWRRAVTATGDDLGTVTIRYQVCDAHRCLRPTTIDVPIVDRR